MAMGGGASGVPEMLRGLLSGLQNFKLHKTVRLMAGLWIVVFGIIAVVMMTIAALARGSGPNNELPYWVKVVQIFPPAALAVMTPSVVLWYQTFTQCVRNATTIRDEYPRLEDEFFFRRQRLFDSIRDAKTVLDVNKSCEEAPFFYKELKQLGLADISYQYGQLSRQVEGHRKWEGDPGKIETKYLSISYGVCPQNLKEEELGALKKTVAQLQEFDEKNKIVGKVTWDTQCGLWRVIRLALGYETKIISFSQQLE